MRIIRRLFYTTITTFIILTIYTISNIDRNVLRTNLEIENITNLKTDTIYLLNKDNYLTKVDIFLDSKNQKDKIYNIVEYLKKTKNLKSNYKGYIPKNTKIISLDIKDKTIYIDLTKDFNESDINISVPGLVKSLLEIKNIDKIDLKVEGKYLKKYNRLLTKDIAINKKYYLNDRKNINKVVIYYLTEDNNYIPVTKYLNDKREKIEIIVDELTNNTDFYLISYLNSNTRLINYKEENNVLLLNFNKYLIDDKNIIDYNLLELSYSIFDNYDVYSVIFEVDGKQLDIINKK